MHFCSNWCWFYGRFALKSFALPKRFSRRYPSRVVFLIAAESRFSLSRLKPPQRYANIVFLPAECHLSRPCSIAIFFLIPDANFDLAKYDPAPHRILVLRFYCLPARFWLSNDLIWAFLRRVEIMNSMRKYITPFLELYLSQILSYSIWVIRSFLVLSLKKYRSPGDLGQKYF